MGKFSVTETDSKSTHDGRIGTPSRFVFNGSGAKARIWLQRYLNQRTDDDRALFVTEREPHRLSIHEIQYIFKRIAKRRGIEDRVSPHKMRHTLATVLNNQGAPLVTVQSILGHEKPKTTQLYASLSGSSRQQSYQRYFIQMLLKKALFQNIIVVKLCIFMKKWIFLVILHIWAGSRNSNKVVNARKMVDFR